MSTLYFVRHGRSEANEKRIWGGDTPLVELGREQARSLQGRLPEEPDKIVCSGLKRVKETAAIAYPQKYIEVNEAFNEVQVGSINMHPMTKETIAFYHEDTEAFQRKYDGEDLGERAEGALKEIVKYAKEYDTVVIFLSNTLLRCIITLIEGKTFLETRKYYIKNCEIVKMAYEDEELVITDRSAITLIDV